MSETTITSPTKATTTAELAPAALDQAAAGRGQR